MNKGVRDSLLRRNLGKLDMSKHSLEVFSELNSFGYAWAVIVNQPCVYIEKSNESWLVLCCKDQNGKQREFILTIEPEIFLQRIKPIENPLDAHIMFVGDYTEFREIYRPEDFDHTHRKGLSHIVALGATSSNNFIVDVIQETKDGKLFFYPKNFDRNP